MSALLCQHACGLPHCVKEAVGTLSFRTAFRTQASGEAASLSRRCSIFIERGCGRQCAKAAEAYTFAAELSRVYGFNVNYAAIK